MAAFVLSANTNIDALSGKGGGDTYDTNGFVLTIDQDSRVGLNQSTSASLGSITINATKGGKCIIDGTAIWILPYTGGSGNVPVWNTRITQAGQSGAGYLIGVHSSLTAASTATGAAMPASGFIRLKQKTGTFVGLTVLTGIAATPSAAGQVGWIEIVGDEASTVNANRLGEFKITGAWYSIGTTNGSSNQTMQIPNNGLLRYAAGVYIEQTAGQKDYEFYPNAGTTTTTGTEAQRGKVVWIDANGLVRIGNSGAATNGYTPVTGLEVVIGNVFLENCTTAARTANVIPNATIATRYDFTATGGGVINISKCNCAWYLSVTQAYSLTLTDCCFVDAILVSEIGSFMTWSGVGVGNKPTTALLTSPATWQVCPAGASISNSVFARVSQASSGSHTIVTNDLKDFTFTNCTFRANTIRGNATTYSFQGVRLVNCTFTSPKIIQGAMLFTTCDGITVTDEVYVDCVSGNTVTTYAVYVWYLNTSTKNCLFSGLTFPIANTHPYTDIINIAAAGVNNIRIRNIGTYATPLSCGSSNIMGHIASIATTAAAKSIKFQRIYVSATRVNGIYYISSTSPDNTTSDITIENVFTDYGDTSDLNNMLNMVRRGIGGTPALTAATGVYGTHFFDCHTSTTAGRFAIIMNEPSALTAAQVTLSGGAAFTATGGLYMPTIGQIAIFETPDFIIGHTAFQDSALVMAGGTATNYTYRYQIDLNDGNGWSSWSSSYTATQLGTALNGETLDAALGFKLKLEITTGTTNTTAITSVYLLTSSTTTTQAYQYPLDLYTLSMTGIVTGSDVVIYATGTTTVRKLTNEISGTTSSYVYETIENVDIGVFKAGYIPFYIRNYPLTAANASIPIAQVVDRAYLT